MTGPWTQKAGLTWALGLLYPWDNDQRGPFLTQSPCSEGLCPPFGEVALYPQVIRMLLRSSLIQAFIHYWAFHDLIPLFFHSTHPDWDFLGAGCCLRSWDTETSEPEGWVPPCSQGLCSQSGKISPIKLVHCEGERRGCVERWMKERSGEGCIRRAGWC